MYNDVLNDVGAPHDSHDKALLLSVRHQNGSLLEKYLFKAGEFPAKSRDIISNGNGIPDDWEMETYLALVNGSQISESGYSFLEEYLNSEANRTVSSTTTNQLTSTALLFPSFTQTQQQSQQSQQSQTQTQQQTQPQSQQTESSGTSQTSQIQQSQQSQTQQMNVVASPSIDEGNDATIFIIIGVVAGLCVIGLLVGVLFVRRNKKQADNDTPTASTNDNATYGSTSFISVQ